MVPHSSATTVTVGQHQLLLYWQGTGKVAAAMAATELALYSEVDMLACVGTAGALTDGPGRTYLVWKALQHDFGVRKDGKTTLYLPGTLPVGHSSKKVEFTMPGELLEKMEPLIGATESDAIVLPGVVATGDTFIQEESTASALRGLGASIVDMETAAVAQVATAYGLPWFACKATTDAAGPDGEDHFLKNLEGAALRAADLLKRAVQLF